MEKIVTASWLICYIIISLLMFLLFPWPLQAQPSKKLSQPEMESNEEERKYAIERLELKLLKEQLLEFKLLKEQLIKVKSKQKELEEKLMNERTKRLQLEERLEGKQGKDRTLRKFDICFDEEEFIFVPCGERGTYLKY